MCTQWTVSSVLDYTGLRSELISNLIVPSAIRMFGGHALYPRVLQGKVAIAFLAEMMILALHVVLPSHVGALKVEVAVVAGLVEVGILFVLL